MLGISYLFGPSLSVLGNYFVWFPSGGRDSVLLPVGRVAVGKCLSLACVSSFLVGFVLGLVLLGLSLFGRGVCLCSGQGGLARSSFSCPQFSERPLLLIGSRRKDVKIIKVSRTFLVYFDGLSQIVLLI